MAAEIELNNLNNEYMVQYIKRVQATLEQYKAREEASQGVARMREQTSLGTLKTRTEAAHTQSKGKSKVEERSPWMKLQGM